jgi:hypothetical protein
MSTPPSNLGSEIKSAAAADVTKAKAWFSAGNLYPWSIGVASGAVVIKVAHLFGLLKII